MHIGSPLSSHFFCRHKHACRNALQYAAQMLEPVGRIHPKMSGTQRSSTLSTHDRTVSAIYLRRASPLDSIPAAPPEPATESLPQPLSVAFSFLDELAQVAQRSAEAAQKCPFSP